MTKEESTIKTQEMLSNMLNSYSPDFDAFFRCVQQDHRTLQQTFTRLCLKWITICGSPDYRHDERNKRSHLTCKRILELWEKYPEKEGYGFPIDHLPMI